MTNTCDVRQSADSRRVGINWFVTASAHSSETNILQRVMIVLPLIVVESIREHTGDTSRDNCGIAVRRTLAAHLLIALNWKATLLLETVP